MKKRATLLITICITLLLSMTAFAKTGNWIQAADGRWWFQCSDGSYPHSGWEVIDNVYYYFDSNGWMLQGTWTPDYYWVDQNGAWNPDMGKISPVEYEIWYEGNGDAPNGAYDQTAIFNYAGSYRTPDYDGEQAGIYLDIAYAGDSLYLVNSYIIRLGGFDDGIGTVGSDGKLYIIAADEYGHICTCVFYPENSSYNFKVIDSNWALVPADGSADFNGIYKVS